MRDKQTAAHVLMIRPSHFGTNSQTAFSNRFQTAADAGSEGIVQDAAVREFNGLASALQRAGVNVCLFEDDPAVVTPDAVFPNNWISFHADGTIVLYPMLAENRRVERRADIPQMLRDKFNFQVSRTIDFSHLEQMGQFLEGTGSLVIDRTNRIAYAAVSPRTHIEALDRFSKQLEYEVVAFDACDPSGQAIYHTNVLMSVGLHFAIVCLDAIKHEHRERVIRSIKMTGREIIEITYEQMEAFAGNVLELADQHGRSLVAMSSTAFDHLTSTQRSSIERLAGAIVSAPIPTIERIGGGSVRCMLAEIHLPRISSGRH